MLAAIRDLWRKGLDTQQIAAALGIPEHEVYNNLTRAVGRFPCLQYEPQYGPSRRCHASER